MQALTGARAVKNTRLQTLVGNDFYACGIDADTKELKKKNVCRFVPRLSFAVGLFTAPALPAMHMPQPVGREPVTQWSTGGPACATMSPCANRMREMTGQ